MRKSIRIPAGMLAVIALLFAATFTSAQLSLTTTYVGGNGQSGVQFDVVALNTCTITASPIRMAGGTPLSPHMLLSITPVATPIICSAKSAVTASKT